MEADTCRHVLTWCGAFLVVRSEAHCGDAKWAFLDSCGPLHELEGTTRVVVCANRRGHFFHRAKPLMDED